MQFYYNEITQGLTEAQIAQATSVANELAAGFAESSAFSTLTEEQQAYAPTIVVDFARLSFIYHHLSPPNWTLPSLEDVLVYLMPGKVVTDPEYYHHVRPVLHAFFHHLNDTARIGNAHELAHAVAHLEPNILAHAENPRCWSMSKTIYLMALENGMDMESDEHAEAFTEIFSQQLQAQMDHLEDDLNHTANKEEFDRMLEIFLRVNRDEIPVDEV
jgi:hypothetical protein